MSREDVLVGPDGRHYALRLSATDIRHIICHWHWIPMSRGMGQAHIRHTYPGWHHNDFVNAFKAAGILYSVNGMPKLHADVVEIWISTTLDQLAIRTGASVEPSDISGRIDQPRPADLSDDPDGDEPEVGPAASLEGYFDLDEEEQTARIMEMFGFMSPNPDVRTRAADAQRKRRQT